MWENASVQAVLNDFCAAQQDQDADAPRESTGDVKVEDAES